MKFKITKMELPKGGYGDENCSISADAVLAEVREIVERNLVPGGYRIIHIGISHEVADINYLYKSTIDNLIRELVAHFS